MEKEMLQTNSTIATDSATRKMTLVPRDKEFHRLTPEEALSIRTMQDQAIREELDLTDPTLQVMIGTALEILMREVRRLNTALEVETTNMYDDGLRDGYEKAMQEMK